MAAEISEVRGTWYLLDPGQYGECANPMCVDCYNMVRGVRVTRRRECAETDEDGQPVRCRIFQVYRSRLDVDYFLELIRGADA